MPLTAAEPASSPIAKPPLRRALHACLIPESRAGRQLAAVALVDSLGSGMYYTGAAVYFVKIVGLSTTQIGLGLSIGGLVGMVGGVPIGMLADRVRAGRVFIALQILRGLCYAALCAVSGFGLYAVTAALIGLTDAAIPPINQAVVGATVPDGDRVATLARLRAVRNVGFGLGALIATVSLSTGSRAAFLVLVGGNALSYFLVAAAMRAIGIHRVAVGPHCVPRRRLRLVGDLRYLGAAGLNGILAVHTTVLTVAMPLWFTQHTKMPTSLLGVLVALNTALAVALQARFARWSDTISGAGRTAILAGVALAGFGVISQLAHLTALIWLAASLAVLAVILLTCAELWQSGSGWTISYDLADPHRRSAYLSTFQLGTSLQVAIGPWLITGVVFRLASGWLIFGLVTVVAGLLTAVVLGPYRHASGRPAFGVAD